MLEANKIYCGDCLELMRSMPPDSFDCCVTSPPYWGLRDYGVDGNEWPAVTYAPIAGMPPVTVPAWHGCLGLEPTPEMYVAHIMEVFREVRRVLKPEGTLWLNLGDSYAMTTKRSSGKGEKQITNAGTLLTDRHNKIPAGLKPKDLVGIPWRVAFALQADGWYLRSDIIWCLSGGTWLYVRTQKGDMPMTVKDVARLDPSTVQLWNGKKWTQLLGINKSARRGDEIEIVLRSGERISCTPTHRFPTTTGMANAADLKVGDTLTSCRLPEPETPRDCVIDDDAAWFAGLYIAEGSRSGDTIQISGHTKECERWKRVRRIAAKFGGSATITEDGNNQAIRVYGKVLNAIIDELVTGRTSHDKGFAPVVWRCSDHFVAAMVDGYLSGDGHVDGNRWRLGFCRNYNIERGLRTACARLGYVLTLNTTSVEYDGKQVPTFRGELRKERSGHHNEKNRNEIIEIRKARCREVYDIGVEDEPHLFSLASGILTHNSKPNPMPESVTDRPTKAHEYVFLMSKSAKYYYDAAAIREPEINRTDARPFGECGGNRHSDERREYKPRTDKQRGHSRRHAGFNERWGLMTKQEQVSMGRNKRSVWTIATQPFPEAHFATFPPKLIEPCILAGCPAGGIALDPFMGAGTTALVALKLGRRFVGCEMKQEYIDITENRIKYELSQTKLDLFGELAINNRTTLTEEEITELLTETANEA